MDEILRTALRMGIIDIFTVITWWQSGMTDNDICTELTHRVAEARR